MAVELPPHTKLYEAELYESGLSNFRIVVFARLLGKY